MIIEVENVSKSFGGVHANTNISMQVEKGEITGLITYMRTDSTNVSESAQKEARDYVIGVHGKDFVPEEMPKQYFIHWQVMMLKL